VPDLPAISAVIPNRDGAELLPRILPPLLRELPPGRNEILVIDDASADESVTLLARDFPDVRVIALQENVGFGAACNRGFAEAQHELVLLLNSDMEVTPGSLGVLAEHFAEADVFAAGPAYYSDDPTKPRPPEGDPPFWPQLGAPAGGGLFRREQFLALGGFDPLYAPFYWEDIDLGWNAWRRGWRIVYDSHCEFIHLENATIGRLYSARHVWRIRTRNRLLFGWKNLRSVGLLTRFVGRTVLRGCADLVRRGNPAGLLGVLDSVGRLGPALARRRDTGEGLTDAEVLQRSQAQLDLLLRL